MYVTTLIMLFNILKNQNYEYLKIMITLLNEINVTNKWKHTVFYNID